MTDQQQFTLVFFYFYQTLGHKMIERLLRHALYGPIEGELMHVMGGQFLFLHKTRMEFSQEVEANTQYLTYFFKIWPGR